MTPWLTVVGIGEDGLDGLGETARRAILDAPFVIGDSRHLALLDPVPPDGQTREPWPRPFDAGYDRVLARRGTPVCVLASGDPMLHGLGASLARRVPVEEMRVLSAPSAPALAAARLGWPLHEAEVLPLHGRAPETMLPSLADGARLLLLADGAHTPGQVAGLLEAHGFGASSLTVLEHLGGPRERRLDGPAAGWPHPPGADLAVVAVACAAAPDGPAPLPRLPGLPDAAFDHDGQITKRDQRAITLARLAPMPGQRLWDVGAGCGSVAIEWMRAHPRNRAIAIEARADRRARIARNRLALGVPGLEIIAGRAPEALADLPAPDAVFVGGGVSHAGVAVACWHALRPGGRLVASAVTLAGEAALLGLRDQWGGDLVRLALTHAEPLGGFDAWRAARPVTLWHVIKPAEDGAT